MTSEDPETGETFRNGASGSNSENAFTETMDYCARSVVALSVILVMLGTVAATASPREPRQAWAAVGAFRAELATNRRTQHDFVRGIKHCGARHEEID